LRTRFALGYEDANDAARLADDPMHKLLLGRDPVTGDTPACRARASRSSRRGIPNKSHPRWRAAGAKAVSDVVIPGGP
jgi:hypothetical protein